MRRNTLLIALALAGASLANADTGDDFAPDPSFETLPAGTQIGGSVFFTSLGAWMIDVGEIVSAQQDIAPVDGDRMLHFLIAPGVSDDIYALIDAADLPQRVEFTVQFNATAPSVFRASLLSYDQANLPIHVNDLTSNNSCTLESDGDPATWESQTVRFTIPAGTTYVAVGVNSPNSAAHRYADLARLTAVCSDIDADGSVAVSDVLAVLGAWGRCDECFCAADLDGDGQIGVNDLLIVLSDWS